MVIIGEDWKWISFQGEFEKHWPSFFKINYHQSISKCHLNSSKIIAWSYMLQMKDTFYANSTFRQGSDQTLKKIFKKELKIINYSRP